MRLIAFGFLIAILGALLLIGAGPGYRFDLWGLGTAFDLLRWAAYAGLAGAALAIIGFIASKRRGPKALFTALLAVVLGGVAAWIPYSWQQQARSVPPIHDITTDTENPPAFVEILPLREGAPNPAEYGGAEVARQQEEAYPEIQPLTLSMPAGAAFERAVEAAREMGWEIVATDRDAGRIEATATTRWFGFKDDVVVRITATASGSRVDVRSVSRVGRSDVGTNARRIREYLAELREAV